MPLSTVWQSEPASSVAASGPARISGSGSPGPYCGAQRLAQRRHHVLAGDGDSAHPQAGAPARRAAPTRPPAAESAGDPEAVGVAQHEVDGLGADGAGGAEDHDVARAVRHVRRSWEPQVRVGEGVRHGPILTALERGQFTACLPEHPYGQ